MLHQYSCGEPNKLGSAYVAHCEGTKLTVWNERNDFYQLKQMNLNDSNHLFGKFVFSSDLINWSNSRFEADFFYDACAYLAGFAPDNTNDHPNFSHTV